MLDWIGFNREPEIVQLSRKLQEQSALMQSMNNRLIEVEKANNDKKWDVMFKPNPVLKAVLHPSKPLVPIVRSRKKPKKLPSLWGKGGGGKDNKLVEVQGAGGASKKPATKKKRWK